MINNSQIQKYLYNPIYGIRMEKEGIKEGGGAWGGYTKNQGGPDTVYYALCIDNASHTSRVTPIDGLRLV